MMGKLVNNKRTTRMLLILLAVIATVMAAILMVMATSGEEEVSAQTNSDALDVAAFTIEDPQAYAKNLFACKVEDINDTAAVAQLLQAMEMEQISGEYTVEIAPDGDMQVLSLTAAMPVQQANKKTFDSNMEKCAQQMLALIPQVSKVQWTYSVISSGSQEESVTVSIDEAGATEALGEDIRAYGDSQAKFQKLIETYL